MVVAVHPAPVGIRARSGLDDCGWAAGNALMAVVQLDATTRAALGYTRIDLWHRHRDTPVECRSLWLGEADGLVRYEDPRDDCAVERLGRTRSLP